MNADQRRRSALDDVTRRAVPEVARVFHVEGDGVGAAKLVPDVLRGDGRLDVHLREALLDLGLHDVAEVDLRDANVIVRVALDLRKPREIGLGEDLRDALGEDGNAIAATVREPLDDRARERIDDGREPRRSLKFLGDERERGARGLADAEREVPRLAAHGDDEIPA